MTTVKARTSSIDGARYYHVEGRYVPSVNTLKGLLSSAPLNMWLINRHIAASHGSAHLAAGMSEVAFRRMVRATVSSDTFAIDFGNEVHQIAEAVVGGLQPPASRKVLTAEQADAVAANVAEFMTMHEVVPFAAEQAVVRVVDGVPTYAGTLDLLAEMDVDGERGLYVVDWKSGASGIWADAALTTGGYASATHYLVNGRLEPMPKADGAVAVHLRPEKWAVHPLDISDADEVLLALARVLEWRGREKEIVGPALSKPLLPGKPVVPSGSKSP